MFWYFFCFSWFLHFLPLWFCAYFVHFCAWPSKHPPWIVPLAHNLSCSQTAQTALGCHEPFWEDSVVQHRAVLPKDIGKMGHRRLHISPGSIFIFKEEWKYFFCILVWFSSSGAFIKRFFVLDQMDWQWAQWHSSTPQLEAYKEFLREKMMVDDIVRKIQAEDEREMQERMSKQQQTQEFITQYLQERCVAWALALGYCVVLCWWWCSWALNEACEEHFIFCRYRICPSAKQYVKSWFASLPPASIQCPTATEGQTAPGRAAGELWLLLANLSRVRSTKQCSSLLSRRCTPGSHLCREMYKEQEKQRQEEEDRQILAFMAEQNRRREDQSAKVWGVFLTPAWEGWE